MINYNNCNTIFKKASLPFYYIHCQSTSDKYKLAKFIYNNTDNFVMNTFLFLWENRMYWDDWRPLIMVDKDGKIIGMHVFAEKIIDNKRYLKTYYIVVDKQHRGEGIAKKLTMQALKDFSNKFSNFFVNSVQGSDGECFYKKLISKRPEKKINEFGTVDLLFKGNINRILCKNA